MPPGFQSRQHYQEFQEAVEFLGGQLGPLQGLKRVGQAGKAAAAAAGGAGLQGTQAAFSGLSAGAKRMVGGLADMYQQRQARLAQEKARDDWMKAAMQGMEAIPGTPSTMAPGSPGPAPSTPGGQPVVMDVPPDIQRWYQHMVEQQGMPEEHARMLVQDHLQERQAHADPRTEVAPWQQGPSQTDGPHNYFHQAHMPTRTSLRHA